MSVVPHTRSVLGLLVAALALASPPPASACQCGTRPTVAEAREAADVVFLGVVVRLATTSVEATEDEEARVVELPEMEFRVLRVWKGPTKRTFRVVAWSNCDLVFPEGGPFLVFARSSPRLQGRLVASQCDPSKQARAARAEIEALGPAASASPAITGAARPGLVVLLDPCETVASLDLALAHLLHDTRPIAVLPVPARTMTQALTLVEHHSDSEILAATEYAGWLWFATSVSVDAGSRSLFIRGLAVRPGTKQLFSWSVW